jgi:endonuclease YncB( thermonuclease family)
MRTASRVLSLFIFFALLALPAHSSETFYAQVVAVSSGDIIVIESIGGGKREEVRLHGIGAPELSQPYGMVARAFVTHATLFREVNVQPVQQNRDQQGRILALIQVPGVGILQERLLEAGLAWVWPRYCRVCPVWDKMQAYARAQGKGLWADANPVPPWEWRRR